MNTEVVSREDMNYLAQQSASSLNMVLAGMTALMNDTDNKVSMLENQTWFQRMCRTVSGKNKMTQQEIQRNHDKINAYMSQAITELFEQQCIDRQIMMSLGNQLNELYADHIQLKQMLGVFVSKLNEKIESIDNFHMLNTEIEQGIYSNYAPIVAICKILSQMDKRCMQDYRKMNILQRTMSAQNILSDTQITLADYLMSIAEIPMEDIGTIYIELGSLRGNFMANLILEMIENYHFLPDMARKLKNKQALIDSVISNEQLEPSIMLSLNDVYNDFISSKLDMIEGLLPISVIQYDSKLVEAEKFFIEYKLDDAFEIFKTLAEKGNGRAMYFLGEYYCWAYGTVKKDKDESTKWRLAGRDAGDTLASLNVAYTLPADDLERKNIFSSLFKEVLQLAESGDVFAQFEVADMYKNGYGTDKDEEEQIRWLIASANEGFWKTQYKLATYYLNKGDYQQAYEWYKKAAELGNGEAACWVGYFYNMGYGVNKDDEKEFFWSKKSAELGDDQGMSNLAHCYYCGRGVSCDYDEAKKWWKKSAELGNQDAKKCLSDKFDILI